MSTRLPVAAGSLVIVQFLTTMRSVGTFSWAGGRFFEPEEF